MGSVAIWSGGYYVAAMHISRSTYSYMMYDSIKGRANQGASSQVRGASISRPDNESRQNINLALGDCVVYLRYNQWQYRLSSSFVREVTK